LFLLYLFFLKGEGKKIVHFQHLNKSSKEPLQFPAPEEVF